MCLLHLLHMEPSQVPGLGLLSQCHGEAYQQNDGLNHSRSYQPTHACSFTHYDIKVRMGELKHKL